jgi:5-methylcytosine-specific restriction protein A
VTGRSVPEWIGETPDTAVPPRVRVRVFDRKDGRCGMCGRKIPAGKRWTCEHVKALVNGGENRESNLGITCDWCLPAKNGADVAEKSSVYRQRAKHIGVKPKGRPMPGSRASGWRKPFNRPAERRDA